MIKKGILFLFSIYWLNPGFSQTFMDNNVREFENHSRLYNNNINPLPIAVAIAGARVLLDNLKNDIIPKLTGEVKNTVAGLTNGMEELLNRASNELKDKLDYTFDKLDRQEKKLMQDLEHLIYQIKKNLPGTPDLYNLVAKTHIAAYEVIQELPTKNKIPMLAAYDTPYNPNTSETKQAKLLGAYLNFDTHYNIWVAGCEVKPDVIGRNEIVFTFPTTIIDTLQNPKYIQVKASPKMKSWNGLVKKYKEQSISILVYPKVRYKASYKIYGKVSKKVTKTYSTGTVVKDGGNTNGSWTYQVCNPYSGEGYWCESYGKLQWFPQNDGRILHLCKDKCSSCLEVCGNTKDNGRAQFEIALYLAKYEETSIEVEEGVVDIFPNSKTQIIEYKFKNNYSNPDQFQNIQFEYLITVEKIYGRNNIIEIHKLSSSQTVSDFISTDMDNLNSLMTIKIDE